MLSKIGMMGTLTIKNAPTSYAHSQASNSQAANGVGVSITSKNQNAAQEAKSAEIDNKANISERFAESWNVAGVKWKNGRSQTVIWKTQKSLLIPW